MIKGLIKSIKKAMAKKKKKEAVAYIAITVKPRDAEDRTKGVTIQMQVSDQLDKENTAHVLRSLLKQLTQDGVENGQEIN